MRGLFYIFLLVIMVGAVSCSGQDSDIQKDPTIKVCTYNLWCAHSRTKFINSQSDIDPQRYWKPSSCAMLSAIRDLDCDIFAFQEIFRFTGAIDGGLGHSTGHNISIGHG